MNPTPAATAPAKTNGLALASLVLGILSLIACGVGVIFSVPGLICGIMGLKRVKRSNGAEKGHGLAVSGIVTSAVSLVMLPVVGLLAAIAVPNFVKAREAAQRAVCTVNLRSIETAKDAWKADNNKEASAVPSESDLTAGSVKLYLTPMPTCPKGGSYTIDRLDMKPSCSIHGEAP